jgi:hypothetical protein
MINLYSFITISWHDLSAKQKHASSNQKLVFRVKIITSAYFILGWSNFTKESKVTAGHM